MPIIREQISKVFDLYQTKNTRCADLYRDELCRVYLPKRTRMQVCATLGFVFTVGKSGTDWSEKIRQRRPLSRAEEMF